jgi:hypothetical protein
MKQPKDLELLDKINKILKSFSRGQIEGVTEACLDSDPEEMQIFSDLFQLVSQLSLPGVILFTDDLLKRLKPDEEEEY